MPFKSKSQIKHFEKAEAKGEMAPGTTAQWYSETKNPESLPVRLHPKQPSKAKKAVKTIKKSFWYE